MSAKFPVEVLTPEGLVFSEEVEMVSTRTVIGSIGIRARHTPFLGALVPTELRLYRSDNDIVRFAQGEGYLQMQDNRALILVEEALSPNELEPAELERKLAESEQKLSSLEKDSEGYRIAEREKNRNEAFLNITRN